jgi:hypothetical protein
MLPACALYGQIARHKSCWFDWYTPLSYIRWSGKMVRRLISGFFFSFLFFFFRNGWFVTSGRVAKICCDDSDCARLYLSFPLEQNRAPRLRMVGHELQCVVSRTAEYIVRRQRRRKKHQCHAGTVGGRSTAIVRTNWAQSDGPMH